MSFPTAFYAECTNAVALTDLVSTRIYPAGEAPQDVAKPYISYQRIDNLHEHHQQGASGITHARYQIDVWGATPTSARAVAAELQELFDGFGVARDAMGTGSNVETVPSMFLTNDWTDIETPSDGSEEAVHRVSQDYSVWYRE